MNYKRDILDINVGEHGEAANQVLRLMAHFSAESVTVENAQIDQLGACPILPVNVTDFLKKLGFCCWAAELGCPQHLAGRFVRSNGILCRDRFVDTFFPMIVIENGEDILKTEVSTEKMSFIAFQDKSYHDRPSYNSWCTKDMNPLRYTGGYYRDLKNYHICVY